MTEVEQLNVLTERCTKLKQEIAKVIVGQEDIVNKLLISMFSSGHCLLVGVPGLAKTLLISTISKTLGLTYNRIQFTPDLMPSDITGSEILDSDREFRFIKGPIFSNIVLADEINRTSPKTQAALLEAMQERCVTVSGKTYNLPQPLFVLATQNPIEQEGTYPLPEAQLDRFMFMLCLDYPTFDQEIQILKSTTTGQNKEVSEVLSSADIISLQEIIKKIPVSDNVYRYVVSLTGKTRLKKGETSLANRYLSWGAGPRASQYLVIGAKCAAALNGKYSPDIEDVNYIAAEVLRHRIVLNYSAQAEGLTAEDVIKMIIDEIN
ncbi:MAG: MoxR family ATPase [Bacteroidales bacterium]|nr:MoxR family ATPase [Bacteroidales bacterium]